MKRIFYVSYLQGRYVTIAEDEDEARANAEKHWRYIHGDDEPLPEIYIGRQQYPEELLAEV